MYMYLAYTSARTCHADSLSPPTVCAPRAPPRVCVPLVCSASFRYSTSDTELSDLREDEVEGYIRVTETPMKWLNQPPNGNGNGNGPVTGDGEDGAGGGKVEEDSKKDEAGEGEEGDDEDNDEDEDENIIGDMSPLSPTVGRGERGERGERVWWGSRIGGEECCVPKGW